MSRSRTLALRALAIILGFVSLFFVFYTVRLLFVTHGLTALRADGNGAYIGAVAFPLLAIVFGFGAWRILKCSRTAES